MFNTTDIEKLLKQRISDEKSSPAYRHKQVREIAKKLVTQKSYMEQELYIEINEELCKLGQKKYSRKGLDSILKPLNLSLEKKPRGRPKKIKIQ